MPAYTVAATAVTLEMPVKWVDNILSHHRISGVSQGRQGVSRRLAPQAVLTLDIALRISSTLRTPISRALALSESLVSNSAQPALLDLGKGISLSIDIGQIRRDLLARLAHAVEIAPSPRRGRPAGP